jgi:hypothetical protein
MRRVGLSAAVAAAILCAASASAHAQQQQYGQPPNTYVTWGTNTPGATRIDVTYFVGDPSLTGNTANLIRAAAAAWNGAGANVNLVEVSGPGAAASANVVFQIGATPGGTFVFPTTMPTTPGAGTFPNGSPWVMINGQVVITANSALMPFTSGTGAVGPFLWDFNSFALQMVGFALGLGPAAFGDPNSVMNPTIPFGPGFAGPTAADSTALQAVYGSPEPATFALFGIGLAALGFTRKFRRG